MIQKQSQPHLSPWLAPGLDLDDQKRSSVCDDKIALEPVIECTLWYKWKYFSSAGSRMEAINNINKLVSIHDQIFCVTSMDSSHLYYMNIIFRLALENNKSVYG